MFYCYFHNWYSGEKQCPACLNTTAATTSSTSFTDGEISFDEIRKQEEKVKEGFDKLFLKYKYNSIKGFPIGLNEEIKMMKPYLHEYYTQEQLDEAIENAFNNSRKTIPMPVNGIVGQYITGYVFKDFEDYKQSLTLKK